MLSLLRYFSLSYVRRRGLKVLLTLVGMATGIAVYTAVDLSNRSVLHTFEQSIRRISGSSSLTVSEKTRKVRDEDFVAAAGLARTAAVTPVLEAKAACPLDEPFFFTVVGIDPISRGAFFEAKPDRSASEILLSLIATPGLAWVPKRLADTCGIRDQSPFELIVDGKKKTLIAKVDDTPRDAGNDFDAVFVDIATAQELWERHGELTRLEILTKAGQEQAWLQEAGQSLTPGLDFSTQSRRLYQGQDLLKAFQLNLLALGLVSVFVSVFIVYNATSLSVLHRRSELGILRSLGCTRGDLIKIFVVEWLILAVLGSLLGVFMGLGLAKLVFGQIVQTVRTLYLDVGDYHLTLSAGSVATAFGIGGLASCLGNMLPLGEIFGVSPLESSRRLSFEKHLRNRPIKLLGASCSAFALAALAAWTSSAHAPYWGFATAFLTLTGGLLLTPAALRTLLVPLLAAARKGRASFLAIACAQAYENPYRYGVVTAALALGIALWLSIGLMVSSFRNTVVDWVSSTVQGDVYLTLKDVQQSQYRSFFPPHFVETLATRPDVRRIDTLRYVNLQVGETPMLLASIELRRLLSQGALKRLSGDSAVLDRPRSAPPFAVAASESFAHKRGLKPGDRFKASTPWGEWELELSVILYDYTSERGIVYIDRADFQAHTSDFRVNAVALFLKNPAQSRRIASSLEGLPSGPPTLRVEVNREMRERILTIFEQTFQVTEALKAVSFFVSFLGILSTLLILFEEKRREIGLLQALGMTPRQLVAYGLSQGWIISWVAYVLGSCCGIAVCFIIIRLINYHYFGWTIFFSLSPRLLLLGLALSLGIGSLATLWPIRYLRKIKPVEALRFEE